MTAIQKRILIAGIKIKLDRGENLEDILVTYVNLSENEQQELRDYFSEQ
jgi:hypothetical protein